MACSRKDSTQARTVRRRPHLSRASEIYIPYRATPPLDPRADLGLAYFGSTRTMLSREEEKKGKEERGRGDGSSKVNFHITCRPRIGTTTCLRRINRENPVPHRADYETPDFSGLRGPFVPRDTACGATEVADGRRTSLPPLEEDSALPRRLKVTCGNRGRGKKSREVRPRVDLTSTRTDGSDVYLAS